MFNKIYFVFQPLLKGLLIGFAAGIGVSLWCKASAFIFQDSTFGLTYKQEKIALIGFSIWFGFFGLLDTVGRFLFWLRIKLVLSG